MARGGGGGGGGGAVCVLVVVVVEGVFFVRVLAVCLCAGVAAVVGLSVCWLLARGPVGPKFCSSQDFLLSLVPSHRS